MIKTLKQAAFTSVVTGNNYPLINIFNFVETKLII